MTRSSLQRKIDAAEKRYKETSGASLHQEMGGTTTPEEKKKNLAYFYRPAYSACGKSLLTGREI